MFSLRIALVWYNSFYLHNFANVLGIMNTLRLVCLASPSVHRRKISPDLLIIGISMMNMILLVIPSWGGICRNSISTMLLSNKLPFDDKDLLKLLPDGVANPCVAGFVIEYVFLSLIALNGLNITPDIGCSMEVTLFQGDMPSFDVNRSGPALYVPKAFNFESIDGIIL
jgi:hypothetical protein